MAKKYKKKNQLTHFILTKQRFITPKKDAFASKSNKWQRR